FSGSNAERFLSFPTIQLPLRNDAAPRSSAWPEGRRSSSRKRRYVLLPSNTSATDTGRGAPYPASDKTALESCAMAWLVLVASGILEAVWATALNKCDGFSRLIPSLIFA